MRHLFLNTINRSWNIENMYSSEGKTLFLVKANFREKEYIGKNADAVFNDNMD